RDTGGSQVEARDDLLGQGARRLAHALREQHRKIGCDVAVFRVARSIQLDRDVIGTGQLTRDTGELGPQVRAGHQPAPDVPVPDVPPFELLSLFEPLSPFEPLSLFVLPPLSFSAAFL